MTNQEKNEYRLRFHRFQKSREKFFAPKIFAALQAQYQSVINNISQGQDAAINSINPAGITQIIQQLYYDAATVYGAKIRSDLNRQKARMPIGFSEQMEALIRAYFQTDILNTSIGIAVTTKDLIRQVFTDAYAKGLGIDDIIKQLENTELSRQRARLIARTETVTAANQGAIFVGKNTGLKLNKEWLATNDKRTRRDHVLQNGQIVGQDDYFVVGGYEMAQPGDRGGKDGKPDVPAREVVNCRCCVLLNPIRENGKLVRQQ
jgi:uncharacterized protein with gpF-like domain